MSHASAELQATIVEALSADPAVVGLLGGPKIFDHARSG